MALRITLKPRERLVINGALIRNGDRNGDILIETPCRFLRESEIIHESAVDTPCKQLWMTLQMIHLSEEPEAVFGLLFTQAAEILKAMPEAAPYVAEISRALEGKHTHKALKVVRRLVQHEALARRADDPAQVERAGASAA
ncbi:flagellar biosynthesis repressor FlbT [Methylobacterium sp. NEAU 140]|uniref:flagellar biosynthesis repressor FlbT n=1 Tax=Methylobacterium sp. NEAU 140 TaxID=3064945 RepID=UPI002733C657|nr:flagellar biosynthesis repressor FlbT [Methylobacterium sp. NEAU 140]MDP4021344.1 flagellar biosynthesis repressor FlbT [Methylobacterium sp. NEAU 140]